MRKTYKLISFPQPMEVEDSEMATATASSTSMTSQEVTMEAQPSTSGATTNRGFTSRLRIESECEDYPEPLQAEPWHAVVPNGWVATLAKDVEEQKKIVSNFEMFGLKSFANCTSLSLPDGL